MATSQPRRRWLVALTAAAAFAFVVLPWCTRRVLSAGLFLRIEGPDAGPRFLADFGVRTVQVRDCGPRFPAPCKAYVPDGDERDGIVLTHGIHADGIAEARMVDFAKALSSAGFYVVTPLLADLAALRVTHAGAQTISRAAAALAAQLGRPAVTVFGISFGGGLALRAACEPALRAPIGRVIALGAQHDVMRVARFFLGEPALGPDGERADVEPHPYGREVIWRSLYGVPHKGPFNADERARILAALGNPPAELRDASPSYCPERIRVPVFLVHGLGDRVIPYTETLWNRREFAKNTDVTALLSPAIAHADYHPPELADRVRLVDFMARAAF